MNKILFDHEKLNVYQNALDFVEWIDKKILAGRKKLSVYDQIDRASTSIPLNIAEGNGKYSSTNGPNHSEVDFRVRSILSKSRVGKLISSPAVTAPNGIALDVNGQRLQKLNPT